MTQRPSYPATYPETCILSSATRTKNDDDVAQLDGADDVDSDDELEDDDYYNWNCAFCDAQGSSMKDVVRHRKQCHRRKNTMHRKQFQFYNL